MMLNLKRIRGRAGLTQSELAQKSGVSRYTISMLETGFQERPTVETLQKLASVLGVSANDLTEGH